MHFEKVADLRKTMVLFKDLLNFDELLKRKFCGILRVLKELRKYDYSMVL